MSHEPQSVVNEELMQQIHQRLQTDPQFRARAEDDPVTTLLEAGVPEAGLRSVMRREGLEGEVMGYMEELEDAF